MGKRKRNKRRTRMCKKKIDYVENMFISVGRPYNVKVIVKGVEKNIIAKRRKMNIPLDSL